MIEDPAPGYQLVYDARWGASPFVASLVLLGGGLILATLLVFVAKNVRVYTSEIALRTLGEQNARYLSWFFASVLLAIAVYAAISGPIYSARREAALSEGRCEWLEGTVEMVDLSRGGPYLLIGKRWLDQSSVWTVQRIPVGTRVRWCRVQPDEEPLRVEIMPPARVPAAPGDPGHRHRR